MQECASMLALRETPGHMQALIFASISIVFLSIIQLPVKKSLYIITILTIFAPWYE